MGIGCLERLKQNEEKSVIYTDKASEGEGKKQRKKITYPEDEYE